MKLNITQHSEHLRTETVARKEEEQQGHKREDFLNFLIQKVGISGLTAKRECMTR